MLIILGMVAGSYYSKNKNENKERNTNSIDDSQGSNLTMNLGSYNHYLEPDEICLLKQEDVAWYSFINNVWEVEGAGTLYLTNKKVIVYDNGFSNLWTKLSSGGDFPEQVYGFLLEEFIDVQQNELINVALKGILVSTINGSFILAPSQRKYSGRKTSIMEEYPSLNELGERLIGLKTTSEIDKLQKKIENIQMKRLDIEEKLDP